MTFGLGSVVTDFVPGRLLGDKLVKLVLEAGFGVERVGCNRETVFLGQDFTKRGAADSAETSAILVRGCRPIQRHLILASDPRQLFFLDEDNGACAGLSAPGTMARAHHGRFGRQLKSDGAATAASLNHPTNLPVWYTPMRTI